MSTLDVVVQSDVKLSTRARQVCGMFDCPPEEKQRLSWKAELPLHEKPWSIGLIVGPSGCGKSIVARSLWPEEYAFSPKWETATVIDAFSRSLKIEMIANALNSVGFSTIPAWLRPFSVLSTGEQFRVDMARRLLESKGLVVVDEFTSVVDRQVAKVACHAVGKFVRKGDRQMVAVSCHNDITAWLRPDWIFDPAELTFRWRSLRRRPKIHIAVARIPWKAWKLFAPFHYLTASLHRSARCYGLWANDSLASFAGVMHRPHKKTKNLKGFSRVVTLPDWQGLGLSFVLMDTIASAHKSLGFRTRAYPAHPGFVRSFRPTEWVCVKRPGTYAPLVGATSTVGKQGGRPCAVFEYIGGAMNETAAGRLLGAPSKSAF